MAKETTPEELNATESNDAVLAKEEVKHPVEVPFMVAVGTPVSINKTTLSGTVGGYHISDDKTVLSYLVDYEEEGEKKQRAFLPNQVTKK